MPAKKDWAVIIKPLLLKYRKRKHPLEYHNYYQLIVMVILSARSTDQIINDLAPALFKKYPTLSSLSAASSKSLQPLIGKVREFHQKTAWLLKMAQMIKEDKNLPVTLDTLTELPGIGRKSANVILRESGKPAEGVIVDLHVVRVAPRLGIASGTDAKKIEEQIMKKLPPSEWDAGMALSFLGREICRPRPLCEECLMKKDCQYFQKLKKKSGG